MCSEITEQENEAYLSRRALGLGTAAVGMLSACGPRAGSPPSPTASTPKNAAPTGGRTVTIDTPDGQADGVFVAPDEGKHPGVLLWPDVAGLRPAYETMAKRLAEAGYAVLLVNPYYRHAKSPVLKHFDEWRNAEGKARIAPMREALTPERVASDGTAFVAWLDQQAEVDITRKVGCQGYCMSGSFAFRVAAAVPDRVGAFASFHGGGLVTDGPDSPHALFTKTTAAALVCIAQNDHARSPEAEPALRKAAANAGRPAEIEIYAANHGWCALDSPVYDESQAERAWSRLLATYAAHL